MSYRLKYVIHIILAIFSMAPLFLLSFYDVMPVFLNVILKVITIVSAIASIIVWIDGATELEDAVENERQEKEIKNKKTQENLIGFLR